MHTKGRSGDFPMPLSIKFQLLLPQEPTKKKKTPHGFSRGKQFLKLDTDVENNAA